MMKFFRKHNKELLAVFMVLLMIVFLGGSALDNLLRPSQNRVVAHTRLGDISYFDRRTAEHYTDILARRGQNWRMPFFGMTEQIDTIEWIILTREAEDLGLVSTSSIPVDSADDLNQWSRVLRVKPAHIVQANAQLSAIQQTALAVAEAASPSEAEILAAARDALEKVSVGVVLLPADAFVDETEEFPESELETQFNAHRETEPGTGMQFGYYVAPAVKVQYMRIDRDMLAENAGVASLERKAKAYFEENQSAFRRPAEEMVVPEYDDDFVGPPEPRPSPLLSWEEASGEAKHIIRRQEADATATQIADWLVQYMAEPWIDVERDKETRYKKVPEQVAELAYYDEVLTRVPRTIDYPGTISIGITDFFNQDEAGEVEGIGEAVFRPERGVTESLRSLAFLSQGVVPVIPLDEGINFSDFLSHYQTCRYPLKDAEGNVYIFRVVEAVEGHVPESLDEVRDRVVADLQLKEGYEAAKARAESLRSCADAMTLVEAYETDDELLALKDTEYGFASGYFDPPPFSRSPESPSFGGPAAPDFRDPIADPGAGRLIGDGVGLVPYQVVDSIFKLAEAEHKTAVFELPDRATVMVVEWLETEVADGDTFEEQRERLVRQLSFGRTREILRDWMDPAQIRARNGFELTTVD